MDSDTRYRVIHEKFAAIFAELNAKGRDSQGISFTTKTCKELLDHGEEGVSLEILAQNIYEFSFPLSRAMYEHIDALGRLMEMDPKGWQFLLALVVEE